MLLGLASTFGQSTQFVGGTSADNDVTGKWKQWNSKEGVSKHGASVAFVLCHCSAQVESCAFTGYSPMPTAACSTSTSSICSTTASST